MFAKLIVVVLAAALTAASLLVVRHRRFETAYDIAVVHRRLVDQRAALWKLKREVAARSTPDAVRALLEHGDLDLTPIAEPVPGLPAPNAEPLVARPDDADDRLRPLDALDQHEETHGG